MLRLRVKLFLSGYMLSLDNDYSYAIVIAGFPKFLEVLYLIRDFTDLG